MAQRPGILFTAFEPSGDALAAPVIAALRATEPDMPIYALGGPKMQQAGAQLLLNTTDRPVMGLGAIAQVGVHLRRLRVLGKWLRRNEIKALVPVDSPAANWSICKMVRRRQREAKIVHLVAPQIWAWGGWRITKLRRLTDHVMCILPFEPGWFATRQVKGSFVGHALLEPTAAAARQLAVDPTLPKGQPQIALLPGSRRKEIAHNWPTMFKVVTRLHEEHRNLVAAVAAIDDRAVEHIRKLCGRKGVPDWLTIRTKAADAVLNWCDVALVVSGTATLQTVAHLKPQVVVYYSNWFSWNLVWRWLLRIKSFALPNIVGRYEGVGAFIPEFVPHHGKPTPIVHEMHKLIRSTDNRKSQVASAKRVVDSFGHLPFGQTAAQRLLQVINAPPADET